MKKIDWCLYQKDLPMERDLKMKKMKFQTLLKNKPYFSKMNSKQLYQFLKIIFPTLLNSYTGHILLDYIQKKLYKLSWGLGDLPVKNTTHRRPRSVLLFRNLFLTIVWSLQDLNYGNTLDKLKDFFFLRRGDVYGKERGKEARDNRTVFKKSTNV